MKRHLARLTLLLIALFAASAGQARPFYPFCSDICCDGTASPTTPCTGAGGVLVQCGPPYAYFCTNV